MQIAYICTKLIFIHAVNLILIFFEFYFLFIGLERVAEELMGRRKWKLYQEVITRSHLNSNIVNNLPTTNTTESGNFNFFFLCL